MALAATKLAIRDANLSKDEMSKMKVGTCIGTTMGSVQTCEIINELIVLHGRTDFDDKLICQVPTHSAPSAIAREFGICGPSMMFSTACAAGNYAIGYAFDLIRFGRADMVVTGGSDPLSKVAFTGFNQFSAVAPEKCQPFDKNRKGMMVAEGAGIVVLEPLETALSRKVKIYAEVLGYGLSCDAFHMTTSSTEGIAACMRKAIQETGIAAEHVDYISAHGTGTLTNDRNESAAIKEVFGSRYNKIPVSSIKSMLGHTMGAASAIEAIACALAVKNDVIPPTINYETPDPECDLFYVPNTAIKKEINTVLSDNSGFGGHNTAIIFKKFEE
jgi:3-oxoacyl-[acyl-carrier-protein] synthase II